LARRRSELGSSEDLRSQVGRGSEEEPYDAIWREGDLRLGARFGLDRARAEAGAVAAAAVPLRETAARCRA
jgi:hypothetical protein